MCSMHAYGVYMHHACMHACVQARVVVCGEEDAVACCAVDAVDE